MALSRCRRSACPGLDLATSCPCSRRSRVLAERIRLAVEHSQAGYLTTSDRSFLRRNPDLAVGVTDPTLTTEHVEVRQVPVAAAASTRMAAAVSCRFTHRYRTVRSTLGSVRYRYHTAASWCSDGSRVTSVTNRQGYFTDVQALHVIGGRLADATYTLSPSHRQVHTSQAISFCPVRVGCVYTDYPYGRINLYGNGTHTYSSGGG